MDIKSSEIDRGPRRAGQLPYLSHKYVRDAPRFFPPAGYDPERRLFVRCFVVTQPEKSGSKLFPHVEN